MVLNFFCTIVGKRQREKGTIGNEGEEIEYFAMLEAKDRGIEAVNIFNQSGLDKGV